MKIVVRELKKCTPDVLGVQRVRRDKRYTETAVHNRKGNGYMDDLMVDEIAILKWNLVEGEMRARFVWLRTRSSGGSL
jgi:hypothetical protein